MNALTKKWLERAQYDLVTAEAMLKARRYLYVAYMCQQSIEKILKAIIVESNGKSFPTHNLTRLAEEAKIYAEIGQKRQDFLADLTPFAIEARYGDYRKSLSEIIDRKKSLKYLAATKEVFKWLRKKLA